MDVYLVPVGREAYELYCETPDEPPDEAEDEGHAGSLLGRLRASLRSHLSVERDGRRDTAVERPGPRTWRQRLGDRLRRWVAESIAEQRLLWRLRREDTVCLFYPEDLDETQATGIVRAALERDADRHRTWLFVDGTLLVASGVFALVPGPNLLAYYLAFRVVGHFLSLRGARHGLEHAAWRNRPSGPLAELRDAIGLPRAEQARLVDEVASRLDLERLAAFFERTRVRGA